jgi:hypothetical protein
VNITHNDGTDRPKAVNRGTMAEDGLLLIHLSTHFPHEGFFFTLGHGLPGQVIVSGRPKRPEHGKVSD